MRSYIKDLVLNRSYKLLSLRFYEEKLTPKRRHRWTLWTELNIALPVAGRSSSGLVPDCSSRLASLVNIRSWAFLIKSSSISIISCFNVTQVKRKHFLLNIGSAGTSVIEERQFHAVVVAVEENVVRIQFAVDDAPGVQVTSRLSYLARYTHASPHPSIEKTSDITIKSAIKNSVLIRISTKKKTKSGTLSQNKWRSRKFKDKNIKERQLDKQGQSIIQLPDAFLLAIFDCQAWIGHGDAPRRAVDDRVRRAIGGDAHEQQQVLVTQFGQRAHICPEAVHFVHVLQFETVDYHVAVPPAPIFKI